jgi:hypothetical protein
MSQVPVESDTEELVDPVGSLLEAFSGIADSRKARGIRFPLAAVLGLCVTAFICGRQNLTQVMRFGRDHRRLLKALGFRGKKAPSVPTLSRVLGGVKPKDLQRAFGAWFAGLVDSGRKRRLCDRASVDGKSSRSSGVHVLNVFLHDVEQVVWQTPVDEKANEISAFKASLDALLKRYPFLQIVTGDAMFAGAPLCGDLLERGRHYFFQIKADQKNLLEKMELVFAGKLARAARESSLTGEKKRLRSGARGVGG